MLLLYIGLLVVLWVVYVKYLCGMFVCVVLYLWFVVIGVLVLMIY